MIRLCLELTSREAGSYSLCQRVACHSFSCMSRGGCNCVAALTCDLRGRWCRRLPHVASVTNLCPGVTSRGAGLYSLRQVSCRGLVACLAADVASLRYPAICGRVLVPSPIQVASAGCLCLAQVFREVGWCSLRHRVLAAAQGGSLPSTLLPLPLIGAPPLASRASIGDGGEATYAPIASC